LRLPSQQGAGTIPAGKRGRKGRTQGGSEDRYRLFVENFQGIAFQGDTGTKPGFFHGGIEKMTGFKEKDFSAGRMKWDQLIHPEDRDRIKKEMEALQEKPGQNMELEYRIMAKRRSRQAPAAFWRAPSTTSPLTRGRRSSSRPRCTRRRRCSRRSTTASKTTSRSSKAS